MIFLPLIIFVIFFVVFLFIGLRMTSHKSIKKDIAKTISTVSAFPETYEPVDVFVPVTPVVAKKEEKFCEYCGSKIKDGEAKCEACGAKIKTNK